MAPSLNMFRTPSVTRLAWQPCRLERPRDVWSTGPAVRTSKHTAVGLRSRTSSVRGRRWIADAHRRPFVIEPGR